MDREQVLELEERLRQAMLASDVKALDALLAPELVFTTFLGDVIGKADDLEAHGSGLVKMHSIELSEQKLTELPNATIVTCLAEIDATFNDDRTKKQFRFTRVWSPDKSGKPRVIVGQATLVYASLTEDL